MKIEKAEAWLLNIPLKYTYHLSFADVAEYNSILVRITSGDRIGTGESTPLPGYDSKTAVDVWAFVSSEIEKLPGKSVNDVLEGYSSFDASDGFAYCALNCALEMLDGGALKNARNETVKIVGTLNGHDVPSIKKEIGGLCSEGYHTLKVKVGRDVAEDIKRIELIDKMLPDGVMMRIDANQGYTPEDAEKFLKNIPASKIELFEQPLAVNCFEETAVLRSGTNVPIMLDESIRSVDDISRAVSLNACDYIKLKLMKCGSISRTLGYAKYARENGLGVVLGNGVQSDIGSCQEALIQQELDLTAAGEMNGFNKQTESILVEELKLENAGIRVPQGFIPEISPDALNKYVKENLVCS